MISVADEQRLFSRIRVREGAAPPPVDPPSAGLWFNGADRRARVPDADAAMPDEIIPHVISDHTTGDHVVAYHLADEVYAVLHRRYPNFRVIYAVQAASPEGAASAILAGIRHASAGGPT